MNVLFSVKGMLDISCLQSYGLSLVIFISISLTARYKRTLPAEDDKESPIGRSFYNAYQVSNKIDLEKKLNKISGLEYEWLPEGSLTVTTEPIPGEIPNCNT